MRMISLGGLVSHLYLFPSPFSGLVLRSFESLDPPPTALITVISFFQPDNVFYLPAYFGLSLKTCIDVIEHKFRRQQPC